MYPDASSFDDRLRALHDARDAVGIVTLLEEVDRSDVIAQPRSVFYLADAMRRLGRREHALDLLRDAASSFERRGNDELHRRRLNLEGAICFDIGRIAEAERVWLTLLQDASDAGDAEHVARANHNLGAIYTLHIRAEEAISAYERAMAAYRTMGNRRGLAQCHHNLGLTYRELDFAPKADGHFLQAIRYAIADHSEDEIARAEQERALLIYASRHDAPLARITANRALGRFSALQEYAGVGETMRVLGLIELGERHDAQARAHFRDALAHAEATRNPLLQAESLEAVSVLEERAGDRDAAQEMRMRAEKLFDEIGATEWGKRERQRVRALAS
jgi:tetratricopeptide (TPR) repeat protein